MARGQGRHARAAAPPRVYTRGRHVVVLIHIYRGSSSIRSGKNTILGYKPPPVFTAFRIEYGAFQVVFPGKPDNCSAICSSGCISQGRMQGATEEPAATRASEAERAAAVARGEAARRVD